MIGLDVAGLKKHWFPGYDDLPGRLRFYLHVDDWGIGMPGLESLTEIGEGVSDTLAQASGAQRSPCAGEWFLTPYGWSGVVTETYDVDEALEWLELFVAAFGDFSDGQVRGGPPKGAGRGLAGSFFASTTSYLSTVDLTTLDAMTRNMRWAVAEEPTREFARCALDWIQQVRGEIHLRRGVDWWVQCLDLVDDVTPLVEAIRRVGSVSFESRRSPDRFRHISVHPLGRAFGQIQDPTLSAREQFNLATQLMLFNPSALNYAYVAWTEGGARAEEATNWPFLGDGYERQARHLMAHYVVDAQPVQLLTTAHLDKAHDLGNWLVEEVAPDRFLVTARDLDPWLAQPGLDLKRRSTYLFAPGLKERAREEFGDMILTDSIVKARRLA